MTTSREIPPKARSRRSLAGWRSFEYTRWFQIDEYTAVKILLTAGWDTYNRVGETSISRTSCTIVWHLRMVRNCWDPEVDWNTDRFHDLRLLQDQRHTSESRWHERLAEFYVRPSMGRDTDGNEK